MVLNYQQYLLSILTWVTNYATNYATTQVLSKNKIKEIEQFSQEKHKYHVKKNKFQIGMAIKIKYIVYKVFTYIKMVLYSKPSFIIFF